MEKEMSNYFDLRDDIIDKTGYEYHNGNRVLDSDELAEKINVWHKNQLINFIKYVGDGYNFEENAEKIVNEYLSENVLINGI